MPGDDAKGTFRGAVKRFLTRVAIALAVLVVAYLLGFQRGHAGVSAERANHEARLREVETRVASTQADLAKARGLANLMAAHSAILQAALDLDQRNFGTATSHLHEAAGLTEHLDAAAAGIDAARLDALRSRLAAADLSVAADLGTQRQQILAFADEMSAMASKHSPPPAPP